jgi:putative ABC transport system permease protein
MVDSFRGGVTLWLNDLLNADLYIAPAAFETGDDSVALKPEVIEALRRNPAIAHVSTYRHRRVVVGGRPAALVALELAAPARAGYRLIQGDPQTAWRAFDSRQAVIISEPLSYRTGLAVGEDVVLETDRGPQAFPVAGVFLDYGSEHGRILLARQSYRRYWDDATVDSAAAYGAPGGDLQALRDQLQAGIGHLQPLVIRSNRHLVDTSLEVFERTFTITNVLRLLAIAVAFIGMLSALMALQLERGREFAMLRANGMTPGQVGWLVTLQTGFMGFAAGLLSIPVGLGLAAVLILVINRRAFGWTFPFTVDGWILAQSILLAMAAALLAGVYPIWRMARSRPADALRCE